MTKEDAEALHRDLAKDADTFFVLEDSKEHVTSIPPTKLKNIPLLRPFEMFVKMYGLPSYGEFDPTLLIAITYSIFFGFMFGDAGQGLVLLIGGFLLYKSKNRSGSHHLLLRILLNDLRMPLRKCLRI